MLTNCLRALDRQTFRDFEVIIVDNGQQIADATICKTGTAREFRRSCDNSGLYPFCPVKVLSPETNIGFGAAINLAVKATDARFIATLNDDTEPEPGWLDSASFRTRIRPADWNVRIVVSVSFMQPGNLDSAGMLICLDGSSKQRGGSMPHSSFASSGGRAPAPAHARRSTAGKCWTKSVCSTRIFSSIAKIRIWGCAPAGPDGAVGMSRRRPSVTTIHGRRQAFSPLKARFVERNRLWVAIKNFPLAFAARRSVRGPAALSLATGRGLEQPGRNGGRSSEPGSRFTAPLRSS